MYVCTVCIRILQYIFMHKASIMHNMHRTSRTVVCILSIRDDFRFFDQSIDAIVASQGGGVVRP